MKKETTRKLALVLNKKTITSLNSKQQSMVMGGYNGNSKDKPYTSLCTTPDFN